MISNQIKKEGKITVFQLKEDLTVQNVKHFIKKMNEMIEKGDAHLVLDLSEVENCCLLGLVSISTLFNHCRHSGGALKIACLTPSVRRSFRKTNLINTVEVFDDLKDALDSFQSHNLFRSKAYSGSFFLKDQNAFVPWDRLPDRGYVN